MSPPTHPKHGPWQYLKQRVATCQPSYIAGTALLVAPPLLTGGIFCSTPDIPAAQVELVLHSALETLYGAAAVAICWLSWRPLGTSLSLRTVLTASLFLVVVLFSLLHSISIPGIDANHGEEVSLYFSHIARFALPLALLSMAIVPATTILSAPARLLLFGSILAILIPFIAYGLGPEFAVVETSEAPLTQVTIYGSAYIALFLLTALITGRFSPVNRESSRYLVLASILGAIAESLMLLSQGDGIDNIGNVIGHAYGLAALIAALVAIDYETVRQPFTELGNTYATARLLAKQHEDILNSISDGILCMDQRMRVQFANTAARQLAGMSDTAAGLLVSLEGSHKAVINDIKTCLRDGKSISAVSTDWMVDGDDEPRAIEHCVNPLRCPGGNTTGAALVLRDITPQQRLQQDMQAAANYARNLLEASPDPLIAIGPDGIVTDANYAAEMTCGMDRHQLIGTHFVSWFSDTAQAREMMHLALAGKTARELPLVLVRANGNSIHVSGSIAPHRDHNGIRGAFAVVRDVTDLYQTQLKLQFHADFDALTALPNRRQFQEHISRAIARSKRDHQPVAVMVVDLDDFKDINDILGTASGDELLKIVARRLTETLRETDILARLGSDEFGILASSTALAGEIESLTGRIRSAISQPLFLAEREISIACSIGVSLHPSDASDADTLLTNADTAMHRAKENGKNGCQYFKQEMNNALRRRVELAHQLRGALARNEFTLHYQPQVSFSDERIIGVEALLRWNNPELGFVLPTDFIPVAEDTGLILPIGAWVLNEACRQSVRWRQEHGIDLRLAVNLSARQFRDPGLLAMVSKTLGETGYPPALLELELTESMLMRDTNDAAATMEKLKALGTGLAIDDFGTGYSSLAYLKRFPIDKLKIDRSFVMDIPGDTNDTAIVRAVLAMANGLGLKVVAEGAETAEQMDFLRAHGCEVVQGYFVSRPLPAKELPAFIKGWNAGRISPELAAKPLLPGRQA